MGRRRRGTRPLSSTALRELANHPLQGGVRDVMNTNLLAIKMACPGTRLVFEMHDAVYLACPVEKAAATVPVVTDLLNREWVVNGTRTRYPATVNVIERPCA